MHALTWPLSHRERGKKKGGGLRAMNLGYRRAVEGEERVADTKRTQKPEEGPPTRGPSRTSCQEGAQGVAKTGRVFKELHRPQAHTGTREGLVVGTRAGGALDMPDHTPGGYAKIIKKNAVDSHVCLNFPRGVDSVFFLRAPL